MQAVIFDVGRVLVHWHPQVIADALAELTSSSPEAIQAAQRAVHREFSLGILKARAYHRYLVDAVGMDADWCRFYEACCRGLCRDEQALAYACGLKQRAVAVGVISNTNDLHVLWLREQIPELALFDSVIFSSDVGLTKPAAEIYRQASDELGIRPDQALFVDDLPENVAGAHDAGMAGLLHSDWHQTIPHIEAWLH